MKDLPHKIHKVPYIICSAIHVDDKHVYSFQPKNIKTGIVVTGRRHSNCFMTLGLIGLGADKDQIQGFLTSDDRFVTREEAGLVAYGAGQIDVKATGLISEELY